MRIYARLMLLLILLVAGCVGCMTSQKIDRVNIRLPVIMALADVQTYFPIETAYCLIGTVKPPAVNVDSYEPTVVVDQTSSSATFKHCNKPGHVGWYHNHPMQPGDVAICYPSKADLTVMDSDPHYSVMILTCPGSVLVYRLRGDTINYTVAPSEYIPMLNLMK